MSQAKDQDQSMEEILQSIKRIIAEEGTPAPSGSDVLELTDMLDDAPPLAVDEPSSTLPTMSIDEIMAAPLASGGAPAPVEFIPTPREEPASAPKPAPVAAAPTPPPAPAPAPSMDEGLVSDATLNSAAAALNALKNIPEAPMAPFTPTNPASFRSGTTVEDLVMEALKPMLKEWLEANLPGLTERLVEKEVRKLSNRA